VNTVYVRNDLCAWVGAIVTVVGFAFVSRFCKGLCNLRATGNVSD
jgi:hypothetical protein